MFPGVLKKKKKHDPIWPKNISRQSKFYFTILCIVIYTNKKTGPRRAGPETSSSHPFLKFKWSLPKREKKKKKKKKRERERERRC